MTPIDKTRTNSRVLNERTSRIDPLSELQKLAPREREVATIVYRRGACTAKEVQSHLADPISNAAVRSMLVRLVRKGILVRPWNTRGQGQECVYLPTITSAEVQERALVEVTKRYFDGSFTATAVRVLELIDQQLSKQTPPDVPQRSKDQPRMVG